MWIVYRSLNGPVGGCRAHTVELSKLRWRLGGEVDDGHRRTINNLDSRQTRLVKSRQGSWRIASRRYVAALVGGECALAICGSIFRFPVNSHACLIRRRTFGLWVKVGATGPKKSFGSSSR